LNADRENNLAAKSPLLTGRTGQTRQLSILGRRLPLESFEVWT